MLLDNANMCSATVLDRLNPLLEPAGALLLNEAGTANGRPRVLQPHPNFRLILALDPKSVPFETACISFMQAASAIACCMALYHMDSSINPFAQLMLMVSGLGRWLWCQNLKITSLCRHGELSRAMRNRGIEVFVADAPADEGREPDASGPLLGASETSESQDLMAVLALQGVPGSALPRAMVAAHLAVAQEAARCHRQVLCLKSLCCFHYLTVKKGMHRFSSLLACNNRKYKCEQLVEEMS